MNDDRTRPQAYIQPHRLGMSRLPVLEGESRCHHEMLTGQCAWCLGHEESA